MSPQSDSVRKSSRPPRNWVAEIFADLETQLVAYVRRRLGCEQSARDVVQEAFVQLCRQDWPAIEPHAQAWLYKTCRNKSIDFNRREARMSAIKANTDVAMLHDRVDRRPEKIALESEQLGKVKQHLAELPERQQEILRLRLHDNLSYKQISQVTGLSVSNVGYLLHQAVVSLKSSLQNSAT